MFGDILRSDMAVRPLALAALTTLAALAAAPQPRLLAQPAAAVAALTVEEQNVLEAGQLYSQAKEFTVSGQYEKAAVRLHRIIGMPFPADASARELMAGARISLAEVLLLQNRFKDAERTAAAGLDLTGTDARPTYLRSEFLEVLARIAAAQGNGPQSQLFRQRAADCRRVSGR